MSNDPLRKMTGLRTILQQLRHADSYAVPEAALRPQVDGLLRPPSTDEEWAAWTAELAGKARNAITKVDCAWDADLVQWAITERGRVLLQTFPT
jgi:hypothetical protein